MLNISIELFSRTIQLLVDWVELSSRTSHSNYSVELFGKKGSSASASTAVDLLLESRSDGSLVRGGNRLTVPSAWEDPKMHRPLEQT